MNHFLRTISAPESSFLQTQALSIFGNSWLSDKKIIHGLTSSPAVGHRGQEEERWREKEILVLKDAQNLQYQGWAHCILSWLQAIRVFKACKIFQDFRLGVLKLSCPGKLGQVGHLGSGIQEMWVRILVLLPSKLVTLGKSLHLCELGSHHL